MNKYEYLINEFQEKLGENFNLVYNNDEQLSWDDILIAPEKLINGVAHVNSGAFDKINGYSVSTQQLSIQFMIPTNPEVFSYAIQQIEDTFKLLHNAVYEYNSEIIKVMYNYSSDTAKVLVNGTDYATLYVYLNLLSVENALMSNETTIHINGEQLKGVFHTTYVNNHTADSIVKGNTSLVQVNNVNAIQKSLSVDLVMIKNDDLIKRIISAEDTNVSYEIKYYNGILTRTFNGYVVSVLEDGTFNDTLKLKLTFGVANV